jgi:hypothetical protein
MSSAMLWMTFLLYSLLLSKDFGHGHTTSILSSETRLFHCFETEKTPGLISLVVDEAETMEWLRASNFTKSYSFYDTHNILNAVNELRYQRKHLYYFQEIQQRSS